MRDQRIYISCPHCKSARVFTRRTSEWERLISLVRRVSYFKCGNCKQNFALARSRLAGNSRSRRAGWLGLGRMPLVVLALVAGGGGWLGWKYWYYLQATQQPPSAIVVISGGVPREIAAAQLAAALPQLPVIVSGGSPLACPYQIFKQERGLEWRRVSGDYRARSTLTNFTTLVPYLSGDRPIKVIVVTSTGNWPRAKILGSIVFGSRGIAIAPALVQGGGSLRGESQTKTWLEGAAALGWAVFGDIVLPGSLFNSPAQASAIKSAPQPRCSSGYAPSYPTYGEAP